MPKGVAPMPQLLPRGHDSRGTSPPAVMTAVRLAVTPFAAAFLALLLLFTIGVTFTFAGEARATGGGYVDKCGGGKILLGAKERETFVLHNRIRRDHDLVPFCAHPMLEKAARAHSKDMIRRDYFSHDTRGGGDFARRLRSFGYTPGGYKFYTVGENIAYGSGTQGGPADTMERWMASDGHRHNILNPEFRQIGVGAYSGDYQGTGGVTMYTVDFGVRRR